MLSIYQTTPKGKKTRSQLITLLKQQDGLTRNEIVERSTLTYEQVRRQTQNLVVEGVIISKTDSGQRRYFLRLSTIVAALLAAWLPFCNAPIDDDRINQTEQECVDS